VAEVLDLVRGVLAIAGATLVLLAAVGVLRFPDLYSRMHAATKATVVGLVLVAIAGALTVEANAGKLLLATALILVTAPVGAHLLGRSAYRAERVPQTLEAQDDLAEIVRPAEPPVEEQR
jgi:multicomponent Na+:H+ antiporter subunit G